MRMKIDSVCPPRVPTIWRNPFFNPSILSSPPAVNAINAKANEFLFRRVDLEDAVSAHLCAVERAPEIGFGRYIISATTPLARQDLAELRTDAADVVGRRVARYEAVYRRRGWRMFAAIDRVYVNKKARDELGWRPVYDFGRIVDQLDGGDSMGSDLARQVGIKGYHAGPS